MADTAHTHGRCVICLSTAGEAFGAAPVAWRSTDGEARDSDWTRLGPVEADPRECLAGLVAAGHLPEGARLGRWHRITDVELAGYWTVDAPE
jgi:hypothetical protein